MFYNVYSKLCKEKQISETSAIQSMGLSTGNLKNWKGGRTPNTEVLQKIADYFNVTTDYLLGKSEQKNNVPSESENPGETLMFALYGDDDTSDITPDMLDDVKNYAKFIRERNKDKK